MVPAENASCLPLALDCCAAFVKVVKEESENVRLCWTDVFNVFNAGDGNREIQVLGKGVPGSLLFKGVSRLRVRILSSGLLKS
jgi:hypothetical protein